MVNFQFNLASILGVGLLVLAIALPILSLTAQPIDRGRVLQNLVLAPLYLFAGVILMFYGWRFDLIMQLSQILLVGLNLYWVFKDLNR